MSDFHAHVTGLEQFLAKFREAPRIVTEELEKAGKRAGLLVEAKAKGYAPVWRGHLRRSITSTQAPFGTTVTPLLTTTRIGTNVPYARAVEFGRGAGKTPPPVAPIAAWLRSKGSDAPPYAVARAIGRRGIPARPFLHRAFEELRGQIRQEFAQVPKRVIARLSGGG